ncbi:hypothetical protein OEZ86_006247 [Tetradesmus obliquus]|nr:hypothetical protein OEZ86_006247 [Tetradesmus obliquus]
MSSVNCLQRSKQVHSGRRQRSFTTRPTRALVVCNAADSNASAPSRRELLAGGLVAAEVAFLSQLAAPAYAEEDVIVAAVADLPAAEAAVAEVSSSTSSVASTSGAKQVFLDVRVEGENIGRIVVELLGDAGVAGQRFADLAEGKQGVGYRLSKFDGIYSTYIRNEGVKSLSYTADGESLIAGGDSVQALEDEMDASSRRHDQAGLVSIVVREAQERPVQERLVAMGGKLVTLKSQAGEAPNGTSFMITTGPTPELDKTNLVIGRVVGGFDVVQAVGSLPYARPRDSYYDKPFFEAGKALGDKRATVAEKRFNRPLKRVMVADAGVL